MKCAMHVLARTAVLVALCATPVLGEDYYVDAVGGSNANAGTSSTDAWRTITHALQMVPPPGQGETQTIHVAAGTYDPGLGEVFPLEVPSGFELVGDEGSGATWIDGKGVDAALVRMVAGTGTGLPVHDVVGFSMRNGEYGVFIPGTGSDDLYPVLRDLVLEHMTVAGVGARASTSTIDASLVRVRASHNANGFAASTDETSGNEGYFDFQDSDLSYNHVGVGFSSGIGVRLERCRVVENQDDGIRAAVSFQYVGASLSMLDCLVAGNYDHGVYTMGTVEPTLLSVYLTRCTFTGNGFGTGTGSGMTSFSETNIRLTGCVLYGNQDDIGLPEWVERIEYCNVGDGDFVGSNGNFSADPLFRDPGARDFRLSFGSPCTDAADPATPPSATDIDGVARTVDGDLDTAARADVGCHELETLRLAYEPALDGKLALECWGAAGAGVELWLARGPLAPPVSTPFGEFVLDRTTAFSWTITGAAPGPPSVFTRDVPDEPALVGTTFSFQAFTDSPGAPLGRALTNAVSLTL